MRLGGVTGGVSVSPSTPRSTYRVSFDGLAGVSGQAVELVGAAGKVLYLRTVHLWKPSAAVRVKLLKQSVPSTGGTSSTPTPLPLDSANAAASGVVKLYTAAPTPGTLVANFLDDSPVTPGDALTEVTGEASTSQPITIREGESVALSIDASATLYGYLEWEEATA